MKKANVFKLIVLAILFTGCSEFTGIHEDYDKPEYNVTDSDGNVIGKRNTAGQFRELTDEEQEEIDLAPTPTPVPDEANAGIVGFLILTSLLFAGCRTDNIFHGNVGTVRIDSGTKANASAQVSLYSRGGIMEGEASEGSESEGENWTDAVGGGEVDANTHVGGDSTQAMEEVPEEEVE